MKLIFFNQKTVVDSAKSLQKLSGINEIYFDENTVVTFEGRVSFAAGIHFRGNCQISDNVSIDTGSVIGRSSIGINTKIRVNSVIEDSIFGKNNIVGPFCFIRNNTVVENNCIVGSHTEVTRSNISSNVKISHQAFIGDATISENVIIGAGVVFCNYDGKSKQSSYIGSGSLIGSGSMIVSPIVIGSNAIIGAGSVVTKNINDESKFIQK